MADVLKSRYYTRIYITLFSRITTRLPHVRARPPISAVIVRLFDPNTLISTPLSWMAPLGLKNPFAGPSKEPQHGNTGRLSGHDSYMVPGLLPGGFDQGREPPTSHVRLSFRIQRSQI